jgi:hypothetical protein
MQPPPLPPEAATDTTGDTTAATSMPGASSEQNSEKPDASEVSHIHYATLRKAGFSEEDIDDMSPGERARNLILSLTSPARAQA